MGDDPTGRGVSCPECGSEATAIVPKDSTIIEGDDEADGKVWVNCQACRHRFLVFYRIEP